jgi:hypothetical protein
MAADIISRNFTLMSERYYPCRKLQNVTAYKHIPRLVYCSQDYLEILSRKSYSHVIKVIFSK